MEAFHTVEDLRDTRPWLFWAIVVVMAGVFFFVEGHDLFWSVQDSGDVTEAVIQAEEGSATRRVGFFLLGAFWLLSSLRSEGRPRQVTGVLGWLMLCFLVLALASLAWADESGFTLRRLAAFVMICLGAIALVNYFSVLDIIWFVFFSTGLYLLTGLSAEIALGTFHPLVADYRFAGTNSWNMQGINCALLLLTAIFLKDNAKHGRKLFLAAGLIALAFLILSKSRTSLSCAILALLLYWNLVMPLSRKLVVVLWLGIALCLLLLFEGGALFSALQDAMSAGRDSDSDSMMWLTGRVPLWQGFLTYIEKKPFLGYGYGGFWTPSRIDQMYAAQGWIVAAGHSAYLDLLLGLGLLGVVTYVLILLVGLRRSFIYYKITSNTSYAFLVALLTFCVLDGFMESATVQPTLLQFLLITALTQLGFQRPRTQQPCT